MDAPDDKGDWSKVKQMSEIKFTMLLEKWHEAYQKY